MIEKNIQIFISCLLFCDFIKEDSYVELLMKGCLYRVLSLSCVFALFVGSASAKYKVGKYQSSIVKERDYRNQERDQGSEYGPFIKSEGNIREDEVVAIKISDGKIVFFGEGGRYFENQGMQLKPSEFGFFKKYPKLISVDFSNIELTKEMITYIQMSLSKTVRSLIINSCSIAKEDIEAFADIIIDNKQLQYITITLPDIGQAESAKLIAAIGCLDSIKWLNLVLGELESTGCNSLADVLAKSAETLTSLSLGFKNIEDNASYDNMLTSLGELSSLRRLEYSVLQSNERQVENFNNSLAQLENLRDLTICFDDYDSHNRAKAFQNAEKFTEAIANLKNLENLDISNMNLPDSVLQIIANSMEKLAQLKSLNISGNPINAETAGVLSESLKNLENLSTLVANNCKLNNKAFDALCGNLQNSSLQCMFFSRNDIQNSIASLRISQMTNLKALDFSFNNVELPDVANFMMKIPSETKLAFVNWTGCKSEKLDEVQRVELRNKLKIWALENHVKTLALGI